MKLLNRSALAWIILAAVLPLRAHAEPSAPGFIDFGKFAPPSGGGEFVEVNIQSNLISMAARLTEKAEPQVADLLRGLQMVRVNVIGLNEGNRAEIENRVKTIQHDLETQKWDRIVTAQQTNQDVSVYLKTRGGEAVAGLVVTVLEAGRQAVLVNIVGDIRPEKIAEIGERLNIEPLKKIGHTIEKQ